MLTLIVMLVLASLVRTGHKRHGGWKQSETCFCISARIWSCTSLSLESKMSSSSGILRSLEKGKKGIK